MKQRNSNNNSNNNECVYGDPKQQSSTEEDLLTEEDEQALLEAFLFIPTVNNIQTNTSGIAPIAIIRVKTINKIQVDRPLMRLVLDTGATSTVIQRGALPPGVVPNISPENR